MFGKSKLETRLDSCEAALLSLKRQVEVLVAKLDGFDKKEGCCKDDEGCEE